MTTILAIDPGNEKSGFVVWDGSRVILSAVEPNPLVREWVECAAERRIENLEVNLLAIEQIGHYGTGMSAGKTVFDTCIEIGRLIERWSQFRDEAQVRLILRPTVKTHLCGTPRAKDGNVAHALRDRLGEKGTKKAPGPLYGVTSHAMQALALALYVSDTERLVAMKNNDYGREKRQDRRSILNDQRG